MIVCLKLASCESQISLLKSLYQSTENELAENQYYLGQLYLEKKEKEQAKIHFIKAKELYESGRMMYDPYSHQVDKAYSLEIEESLAAFE